LAAAAALADMKLRKSARVAPDCFVLLVLVPEDVPAVV
jgi:hypothetical protein